MFKNIEVAFLFSSSWVKIKLQTENQLLGLPGSGLNVSVGGGGGVGSTALCGHTNFVFGLKLGCDNKNFKQFEHEMYACCCADPYFLCPSEI